jgi:hypothetical protein
MGHHGTGSPFRHLPFTKTHRHLNRMHVERENIQSLISCVSLRQFLENTLQDASRNLIPPPETQSYLSVLFIVHIMDRYSNLIAGLEIA